MTRLLGLLLGAFVLAAAAAAPGPAAEPQAAEPQAAEPQAAEPQAVCPTPPALLAIEPALTYVAAKLAKRDKLTIVAFGSSSTQGIGASAPQMTYPSRLESELRKRFPQIEIRVINRGKGGEDAPEEFARLDRDVIAEDPDLVIWQIGTNALLRRVDPEIEREVLRRGISLIKQSESDVVLMDMQYAPRVVSGPSYSGMQQLIADIAERNRVGLFRRFDIMRAWHSAEPRGTLPVIGADGLHMTDRSYACLASGLAEAIARNWRQHQEMQHALAAPLARLVRAAEEAGEFTGVDEY